LNDETSVAAQRARNGAFRLLPKLGTEPGVYYISKRTWVREAAEEGFARRAKELVHG
jgi:hypothetical protein